MDSRRVVRIELVRPDGARDRVPSLEDAYQRIARDPRAYVGGRIERFSDRGTYQADQIVPGCAAQLWFGVTLGMERPVNYATAIAAGAGEGIVAPPV
jgi:hypothetical protein